MGGIGARVGGDGAGVAEAGTPVAVRAAGVEEPQAARISSRERVAGAGFMVLARRARPDGRAPYDARG
jgi:hypothetical protein